MASRVASLARQLSSTTRSFATSAAMKPIQVYTADTPNGYKVTVFCEELKEHYPDFQVEYKNISLGKNEQKEDWFLKINPNGRIPAIVDPNHGDFPVFETAAILLYLEKRYDPKHVFSWTSSDEKADEYRSEVLQWMFFVHGGLGPMQGQSNHFFRYAPEKIQYGIDRYRNETKRLLTVLDSRLKDRDWLVGEGRGKYSLADANAFPWLHFLPWAGVSKPEVPAGVLAYIERNQARPSFKAGFSQPNGKMTEMASMMWEDGFEEKQSEKIKAHAAQAAQWVQKGMKDDAQK